VSVTLYQCFESLPDVMAKKAAVVRMEPVEGQRSMYVHVLNVPENVLQVGKRCVKDKKKIN
jgi:hypothetical protein